MERGGAAAVEFQKGGRRGCGSLALLEDPLWNFKRGGARPLRPPPESASVDFMDFTMGDDKIVPSIMSYSPQGFNYLMKAIKCLHYTEMFLFLSTTVVPRQLRPTHIRALFSMSV